MVSPKAPVTKKAVRSRAPGRSLLALASLRPRFAGSERDTQRNRIYAELRSALMAGAVEPEELLIVSRLAETLGVGVMPVREALQRLVAEGALTALPNGRVMVPVLGRSDFEQLMELRLLLEPQACARTAERASKADVADIRSSLARLLEADAAIADPLAVLASNYRFHFSLYRPCGSALMISLIENLWLRFGPLLVYPLRHDRRGWAGYAREEGRLSTLLVEAITARDAEAARAHAEAIFHRTATWFAQHFPAPATTTSAAPSIRRGARPG